MSTTKQKPSGKLTAAQVEKNCPDSIQDTGRRIAAYYEKLLKSEGKAADYKITIGRLLADVEEACDKGGFNMFQKRFCPKIGRSRAHELLLIASGVKTEEETKAATRERVKKHRAAKKAEGDVTDNSSVTGEPPGAEGGDVTDNSSVTDEAKPTKGGRGHKPPKPTEAAERPASASRDFSVEQAANPPPEASAEVRKAAMGTLGDAGAEPVMAETSASDDTVENDYAGMRVWFEDYVANAVYYFIDSRIPDMPPKMFCGFESSDDLRSLADYLLRVADEQAKEEADSGDPATRDKARMAAYAVVWAREHGEPQKPEPVEAALAKAINEAAKVEGWRLEQTEHPIDGEIAWIRLEGDDTLESANGSSGGKMLWWLVDLFALAADFGLDVEAIVKDAGVKAEPSKAAPAKAAEQPAGKFELPGDLSIPEHLKRAQKDIDKNTVAAKWLH